METIKFEKGKQYQCSYCMTDKVWKRGLATCNGRFGSDQIIFTSDTWDEFNGMRFNVHENLRVDNVIIESVRYYDGYVGFGCSSDEVQP